jgi:hypothetical protein
MLNPPGRGSEGVWIEPWRVLEGLDVRIEQGEGAKTTLEDMASGYSRQDGLSVIRHEHAEVSIGKRVWVPLYAPSSLWSSWRCRITVVRP